MLPLLFITALMSKDNVNLEGKLNYSWTILNAAISIGDKRRALRNHLRITIKKWLKYYRLFQVIAEGKVEFNRLYYRIKLIINKIIYGEISLSQIIYIIFYCIYTIVISINLLKLPMPFDVIISILFITILRYAGSEYKGIGSLFSEMIHALDYKKNDSEREIAFNELTERIKDDCYVAFLLTEKNNNITLGVAPHATAEYTPNTPLANAKFVQKGAHEFKTEINGVVAKLEKEEGK